MKQSRLTNRLLATALALCSIFACEGTPPVPNRPASKLFEPPVLQLPPPPLVACDAALDVKQRGSQLDARLDLHLGSESDPMCRMPQELRLYVRAESVIAVRSPVDWAYYPPVRHRGQWTLRWRSRGAESPVSVEGFGVSFGRPGILLEWDVLYPDGSVRSEPNFDAYKRGEGPPNKGMKLTNLSEAPGATEAPLRAFRRFAAVRTGSQLIPGVRRTNGG